jgi:hypothetical protein
MAGACSALAAAPPISRPLPLGTHPLVHRMQMRCEGVRWCCPPSEDLEDFSPMVLDDASAAPGRLAACWVPGIPLMGPAGMRSCYRPSVAALAGRPSRAVVIWRSKSRPFSAAKSTRQVAMVPSSRSATAPPLRWHSPRSPRVQTWCTR